MTKKSHLNNFHQKTVKIKQKFFKFNLGSLFVSNFQNHLHSHRFNFKFNLTKLKKQYPPKTKLISFRRVDQFLPCYRLRFVFSVIHLVSRWCHNISTIHPLSLAPLRTVLALLTHTAPHTDTFTEIRTD